MTDDTTTQIPVNVVAAAATTLTEVKVDEEQVILLTDNAIEKLKVSELKEELRKRGQSMEGKKQELRTRLKEAMVKWIPLVPQGFSWICLVEQGINQQQSAVSQILPSGKYYVPWMILLQNRSTTFKNHMHQQFQVKMRSLFLKSETLQSDSSGKTSSERTEYLK